ncbi:unnamed protein product [Protopolystoma xenopodis]|uniref:Uncharacterized protein n=1 Tax=Protopolystoma xenopodis TaxID=117903 RepID=A0A3S5A0A7_9PLAT|nr:unnamed protein product [Protopolystoma xenopodis]
MVGPPVAQHLPVLPSGSSPAGQPGSHLVSLSSPGQHQHQQQLGGLVGQSTPVAGSAVLLGSSGTPGAQSMVDSTSGALMGTGVSPPAAGTAPSTIAASTVGASSAAARISIGPGAASEPLVDRTVLNAHLRDMAERYLPALNHAIQVTGELANQQSTRRKYGRLRDIIERPENNPSITMRQLPKLEQVRLF